MLKSKWLRFVIFGMGFTFLIVLVGFGDPEPDAQAAALDNSLDTSSSYLTAPDIPIFEVTTAQPGTGEGYIFLGLFDTQLFSTLQNPYLFILDDNGEPIFYRKINDVRFAIDFKQQPNGLLTYTNGPGEFLVMDSHYDIVDTIHAGNGRAIDIHDLQFLDNGEILLVIYDSRVVDMSELVPGGDPQALVVGCIVQIIDQAENVLFEWQSWDHIDILESNQDLTASVISYIHCNSVEETNDGNILISNRNLDELTKISRETGEMIWRLGGVNNQFYFVNDGGFFTQHDARQLPNGNITVFDNRTNLSYSRAVEYIVDENSMTATKVWEFRNSPDTHGQFMGSHTRLPNGNSLIGWGAENDPLLTEVTSDNEKVFEMRTSGQINEVGLQASYRAFRFPWVGEPNWPPRLVGHMGTDQIDLYFSWNGATEVASYDVYGGTTPEMDTLLGSQTKDGFENHFIYDEALNPDDIYYFQVTPRDGAGNEMLASNLAILGGWTQYFPLLQNTESEAGP